MEDWGGVSESFFVSRGISVNRWKFGGEYLKFSLVFIYDLFVTL
jgi:hypothetical protein